jgi:hypothetical protein
MTAGECCRGVLTRSDLRSIYGARRGFDGSNQQA